MSWMRTHTHTRQTHKTLVYLDVVDRMNILHRFFDDLSHLSNALMRSNGRDRVSMNENVTIRQQFNGLQEHRASLSTRKQIFYFQR